MKRPRAMEREEGRTAFERFDETMAALLSVPHSELARREREYKEKAALNPRKHGPRAKRKSASPDPGV